MQSTTKNSETLKQISHVCISLLRYGVFWCCCCCVSSLKLRLFSPGLLQLLLLFLHRSPHFFVRLRSSHHKHIVFVRLSGCFCCRISTSIDISLQTDMNPCKIVGKNLISLSPVVVLPIIVKRIPIGWLMVHCRRMKKLALVTATETLISN